MISRLVEIVPGGLSVRHSRHIEKGHLRLTAVLEFVNYILIDAIVLILYLAEQAAAVLGDSGILDIIRICEAYRLGSSCSRRVVSEEEGSEVDTVFILQHDNPGSEFGNLLADEYVEIVSADAFKAEAAVIDFGESHIVDIVSADGNSRSEHIGSGRAGNVINLAHAEVSAYSLIELAGAELLDGGAAGDHGERFTADSRGAARTVNAVEQGEGLAFGIEQGDERLRLLTHRGHIGIRIHIYPALHSLLE